MAIVIEVVGRDVDEASEVVWLLQKLIRIEPVETICQSVPLELFTEILRALPPTCNSIIVGDL